MSPRLPFEGWYGGAYDRTMSSAVGRRLASTVIWGGGTALTRLGATVGEAVHAAAALAEADGREPALVDVPCGGGTLWPLLERAGHAGDVVGLDIADAMLKRAARRAARLRVRGSRVVAMARHGDALDMPLEDASVDGAISINGLHCLPDPAQFLRELRRVLRPGADAWVVTLLEPSTGRERQAIDATIRMGVLPAAPPSRTAILQLAQRAGFGSVEDRGERSVATFRLTAD